MRLEVFADQIFAYCDKFVPWLWAVSRTVKVTHRDVSKRLAA
jgi:hypothetical protein